MTLGKLHTIALTQKSRDQFPPKSGKILGIDLRAMKKSR